MVEREELYDSMSSPTGSLFVRGTISRALDRDLPRAGQSHHSYGFRGPCYELHLPFEVLVGDIRLELGGERIYESTYGRC